ARAAAAAAIAKAGGGKGGAPVPNPGPGYIVKPIRNLRLLPAATNGRQGDARTIHPGDVHADIVTNGTFFGGNKFAGPVIVNGKYSRESGGGARGGVAILKDGTIEVGRYEGPTEQAIRGSYANGAQIQSFMGGGASIVEGGKAVPAADLGKGPGHQGFSGGPAAGQFNPGARHTMLATDQAGRAYLVVDNNSKPLAAMQRDLAGAGFKNVVMFDGGNAFGYEDKQETIFGRHEGTYAPHLSDAEVARLRNTGNGDPARMGLAMDIAK
ncbi:MAG TPA: hypothetical protein VHF22_13490, partial [Planctomycetota bacterium]|nr:hypothetical protein [Planctomycetota bacterium]